MRIMLFSDIPPCRNFTAGIVLNKMCDFLLEEGHEVCCYTVKHKDVDAVIPQDKFERMRFQSVEKPRENWGQTFLKGAGSFIGNNAVALFRLPTIARSAVAFARENQVELVWSVVQGQSMIRLANLVARYSKLPYVVQVWDPPEWWMMENCVDTHTTALVMKVFGAILKRAECCIAASWAMAEDYRQRFHCQKAIPVILGFPSGLAAPKGKKDTNKFVIALSGQIYAAEEFYALLHTLNRMHWNYREKQIIVRLYGTHVSLYASEPSYFEFRGWIDQDELLPELADADLLYCPYWFSDRYKLPASLSFPSKLSTYLKTGVPVLMHGPEYASPRRFLEEHNAAYICGSLDPAEIEKTLIQIMEQPKEERTVVAQRGYQALQQYLTEARMKQAFFQALGLTDQRKGTG